jgi:4-hydroxybutyryl-CoA dehydratase/vinylacetyl-CoA-Delta-isomerase
MRVFLLGELVNEPVDHPIIRPSVNAMAATYDLAQTNSEIASAQSPYTETRVNRFLHIAENPGDLVAKARMQRKLGQKTGTCFQRCIGLHSQGKGCEGTAHLQLLLPTSARSFTGRCRG